MLASTLGLGADLVACGSADSATAADQVADPNGHLRVAFVIPPASLNPHRVASDIGAYPYLTPVYDRLTQLVSADGTGELAPMVATDWTFAPDGRSATFALRDDMTFVDGTHLDAAAVKASFDHALTTPGTTIASHLSMIASIDVVDPTHVRFNTNRPAADLPYVLAGSVGSLISPKALDNPDLDVNPVGSGPYVAKSVKIGDSVVYERPAGRHLQVVRSDDQRIRADRGRPGRGVDRHRAGTRRLHLLGSHSVRLQRQGSQHRRHGYLQLSRHLRRPPPRYRLEVGPVRSHGFGGRKVS
ncbi:ABC transporter substrate-binding protein [Rhodococcus sp. NPDC003318]|uniref:ABC transporter substrate-binding protein n=1 Tax=Rhodococcus sp. NPDC003318 TaxID=3364503 RepID=UPI0036C50734